jgi:hypothetical protein
MGHPGQMMPDSDGKADEAWPLYLGMVSVIDGCKIIAKFVILLEDRGAHQPGLQFNDGIARADAGWLELVQSHPARTSVGLMVDNGGPSLRLGVLVKTNNIEP